MRGLGWLTRVAGLLVGAGCAHVEPPPGGPEDRAPPGVLSTQPESQAVVASYDGPVVFQFDERISEQGAEEAVLVSPRTSPVEVRRGRSAIQVSLRGGWESGVIYQVTLLPQVRDLFGNAIPEAVRLVFSTGPAIPATRVTGSVLDRITGSAAPEVRVEAIRVADSLVYAGASNTTGEFELEQIPEGSYLFRAFDDVNNDRAPNLYEPQDSAFGEVSGGTVVELGLRLLQPDSTAPGITTVRAAGRVLTVQFDDYLDPEQTVDASQVAVLHPTGGPLPISRIALGQLAPVDSASATAVDSLAAAIGGSVPADTTPQPGGAPAPPAAAPGAVDPLAAGEPGAVAAVAPASQQLQVELAESVRLDPEVEYTVTVRRIRNINGLPGDSEETFEPPARPPIL